MGGGDIVAKLKLKLAAKLIMRWSVDKWEKTPLRQVAALIGLSVCWCSQT